MTKTKTYEQTNNTKEIEVIDKSSDAVSIVVNALSAEKVRRAQEFSRGAGKDNNDRAESKGHFKEKLPDFKPVLTEKDEISEQLDFGLWEEQLAEENGITEKANSYTTASQGIKDKYEDISGDLDKVGKTPAEIEKMSPEELANFKKWLLKRAK